MLLEKGMYHPSAQESMLMIFCLNCPSRSLPHCLQISFYLTWHCEISPNIFYIDKYLEGWCLLSTIQHIVKTNKKFQKILKAQAVYSANPESAQCNQGKKKKKNSAKDFFKKSFPLSDESQGSENMSFKTSSNLCCEFIQSLTSSYLNINKQGKTNTWSFHKNRIHLKSHLLLVKDIWNSQRNFTVLENIPLNKQ